MTFFDFGKMHDPWFLVIGIEPLIPVLVTGYQGAEMIWKGQLIERLAEQVDYRETPLRHDYVFNEVKLFPFSMLIKAVTGDTDVNVCIEFQIAAKACNGQKMPIMRPCCSAKSCKVPAASLLSFFRSQRLCSLIFQSSLGMVKVMCCQSQPLGKTSLC